MHWRSTYQERNDWHELVNLIIRKAKNEETRPMQISFCRVAKRLIDDLNVPAGCKWILDALVLNGWLVDDSWKNCRVVLSPDGWQRKIKKGEEEHMEIYLEPLEV